MWKRVVGVAIAVALVGGLAVFTEATAEQVKEPDKKDKAPKPDKKVVKALMGRKLDHSQKLLAALVMNNLEQAGKEAEELLRVRKEASWLIVKTEQYEMWSKEFTVATEQLIKATKDKNYDAAKLRYLELTMTCFHCHAYVRDLGDIGLDGFKRD